MHKQFIQKGKIAFTLAEVLITLLIIGVVASLVIPALINNTNEAEYNVGVKKAQSVLSQAISMIQVNNGGEVNAGNAPTDHDLAAGAQLRNDFCNVMSCIQMGATSNIFPPKYKVYKGGYSNWNPTSDSLPAAILNDGSFIRFDNYSNCRDTLHTCGVITYDMNGKKGPNMDGVDKHSFWITRQTPTSGAFSILPFGSQGDAWAPLPVGCQANGPATGSQSEGCTAKRLMDPDHMP